jgi:hypothetical protein
VYKVCGGRQSNSDTVCIAIAPVFYCAAIYVTISRTTENLDPSLSRIPPKLYYWAFLICDVSRKIHWGNWKYVLIYY